jgi:hypothetical protein
MKAKSGTPITASASVCMVSAKQAETEFGVPSDPAPSPARSKVGKRAHIKFCTLCRRVLLTPCFSGVFSQARHFQPL